VENPYQMPTADVAGTASHAGAVSAFKDPTWLTWACRVCLVAGALASALMIVVMAQQHALFEAAKANGWSVDDVYAETGLTFFAATLLQFMTMMASFVLIGMWIYRAAWNARAFAGTRQLTITPGWAVGWYFIPFANLFKPYQAMKEIWQASARPDNVDAASVPGWLPLWWFLWLAFNIISNFAGRAAWRAETVDAEIDSALASITCDAINIPLCLVLLLIVNRIHRMQWQRQGERSQRLAG
jgi:hypothetical protein